MPGSTKNVWIDRPAGSLANAKVLTYTALLTALSTLLASLYPIPLFTDFLLYQPGDVPIILGGITLGLGPGLLITVVTSVIMAVLTGQGGPIGVFMHVLASGTLVSVITLIYRARPTKAHYLLGAIAATLATTLVMVLWNLILTPIYMGAPREVVIGLLVPAIIPFNLFKAATNSALTYVVFAAVSPYLQRAGVISH
jgi:riboflavin transporter FmnP